MQSNVCSREAAYRMIEHLFDNRVVQRVGLSGSVVGLRSERKIGKEARGGQIAALEDSGRGQGPGVSR